MWEKSKEMLFYFYSGFKDEKYDFNPALICFTVNTDTRKHVTLKSTALTPGNILLTVSLSVINTPLHRFWYEIISINNYLWLQINSFLTQNFAHFVLFANDSLTDRCGNDRLTISVNSVSQVLVSAALSKLVLLWLRDWEMWGDPAVCCEKPAEGSTDRSTVPAFTLPPPLPVHLTGHYTAEL